MQKRPDFLLISKPMIGPEEIAAVSEVLKSGWLTTGPKVKELEENMQNYLGCKKAIGLTSCTGGMHIALAALGIGAGDEVIVPAYTFVATAHVADWLGAKPVLVDVEPDTFNIDPAKIEAAITPHTKAIIPVHFAGHACDMDRIMAIAKKHNLWVIEDAAHAIGTSYKGVKIGNHGTAVVFSFYATKTMTTGEGGMIVTNDEELGKKLKRYSYFGVDKDAFSRYTDKGSWYYEVVERGYKYNMDNIHGALGVEQLKKLEGFLNSRRQLAALYTTLIKEVPFVTTPVEKEYTRHSYHLYPVLIDFAKAGISRDVVIAKLKAYNIGTSVHFIPLHLHPYYQEKYGYKKGDFPVTEALFERELSLPFYQGMSDRDARYVADVLREILGGKA
jgi:dTDP-4-amino-4,6-dideoxygalactose transaminase